MTRLRAVVRAPDTRWLLAVLVLAFAVRLIVATQITPDPRDGRYDDTVWYDTTARHLAAGDGYVFDPTVWYMEDGQRIFPEDHELTPTALWPPGYPIVLGAIYKLTDDSLAAGRFANVVFGTLTVALVYAIARKLFDRTVAVCSGLALALLPSHVLFTSVLLSETFFGFLLALILAAGVWYFFDRARPTPLLVAALVPYGALIAAAGYVRGEFIAYGAVLAFILFCRWRLRALVPLGALAIGALLIITPWTLRNASSLGEPIVGTTGAGRVLYQGHNPIADGGPSLRAFYFLQEEYASETYILPEELRAEFPAPVRRRVVQDLVAAGRLDPDTNLPIVSSEEYPTLVGEGGVLDAAPSTIADLDAAEAGELNLLYIELRANRDGTRLAREWAWDHKTKEINLAGKRMWMLFRSDESGVTWIQSNKLWFSEENADRLTRLSSFVFYGLCAMTLASIPIWWRWRDAKRWSVFAVIPFYMLVFGVLFIGDPRYHYAMYVPLAVFSSVGFAAAWRITAAQWREIAGERSLMSILRTYGTPG